MYTLTVTIGLRVDADGYVHTPDHVKALIPYYLNNCTIWFGEGLYDDQTVIWEPNVTILVARDTPGELALTRRSLEALGKALSQKVVLFHPPSHTIAQLVRL